MMGVTGIDGRGRKTSRLYAGSTPATSTESGCWCKRKLRGGRFVLLISFIGGAAARC